MRLDIVVDYNVKTDEFDDLCKVYPLGKYQSGGRIHWFVVEIDGDEGHIRLVWHKEW